MPIYLTVISIFQVQCLLHFIFVWKLRDYTYVKIYTGQNLDVKLKPGENVHVSSLKHEETVKHYFLYILFRY